MTKEQRLERERMGALKRWTAYCQQETTDKVATLAMVVTATDDDTGDVRMLLDEDGAMATDEEEL